MPHTEHRKKTLRKSLKARERNRATRSAVRSAVKRARSLAGGTKEATEALAGAKHLVIKSS